ncbi:hypothetical protein DICSQDRAFT_180666 [Dichomitus squalens LYAD-421 SS1]|uniref:Ubinuclein middle domain-containing protein n=1 Tax=Dichomitus squalens (strain LYAD-421) TaxID=732165 RepID=R7SZH7_DICSQ|nr:uncharacterized protein DICSQDRAFT_180666 [Dichomitus squalens LYAD-421 SS1]EJF61353.1 hypothetical protein DICSQDRAFT_180666 [Dichomitus squalens LYAD-421 SS1]
MDIAPVDVDMAVSDAHDSHEGSGSDSASSTSSSPPPSPSPAHNSPIAVDDDSRPASADLPPPLLTSDAPPSSSEAPAPIEGGRGRKSKPSSSTVAAAPTGAKPKSTKSAAPRASSPSPPPPAHPARPPLQTIRLEIKLGGPDDYEVNISELAKVTGQRPATPVPELTKHDTSDESEAEAEAEAEPAPAETDDKQKGKRRKRRNHASEYYDTTDPFIDDSELAQDERTFFAQTKQKGFYVSSGQVALLNKPSNKKPKSKKINILAPSASVSAALSTATLPLPALSISAAASGPSPTPASTNGNINGKVKTEEGSGSRDQPIALSDGEDSGKLKRKLSEGGQTFASLSEGGAKKRRKTVEIVSVACCDCVESVSPTSAVSPPVVAPAGSLSSPTTTTATTTMPVLGPVSRRAAQHPFHPELEQAIEVLKEAIAKENWEVKGKFPPGLKPILAQVALKAVILGEYDENFFNLMPRLFPYNKFTMTKLIKRTIWRDHTNLLVDRQNALIEELRALAEEGFPKAKEEWEKSVMQWEKRQERAKLDASGEGSNGVDHSQEGSPAASDAQATPMMPRTPLDQVAIAAADDGEHEDGAGGGGRGRDTHPPAQRYRLTDQMKTIIWQLVCLSNECCRIENEKNALEGSNQIVSDQGVRKNLYQKIVAAFPDGWLSSGQISREVSVMKKKYEKEAMEND